MSCNGGEIAVGSVVLLRARRRFDPRFRGKTPQEALNINDGDDCPLALVYSRSEVARLFHRFANLEFSPSFLNWNQLFMRPPLVGLAERFLRPSSRSWPARLMGWNLNIHAVKPAE